MDPAGSAAKADVVFLALPHKASQDAVAAVVRAGKRAVDLSADFSLRDPEVYEAWYNTPHGQRTVLRRAVYGLPELYRARIRKTAVVANPGCYPTGALLALLPAVRKGIVETDGIVIDSKSGTSGAGRGAKTGTLYCEVNEGFRAYGIGSHRHTPEIEQELSRAAKKAVVVDFTPHLVPMDRGILTTVYARIRKGVSTDRIEKAYRSAYGREPFVRLLSLGDVPSTKHVRGSNFCHVGLTINTRTGRLVIVSAIDNLVKGASGQAIHNMNIMFGLPETRGLEGLGIFP
jgi:N-acetyl-gamma-glutamyl-phosphate reductase